MKIQQSPFAPKLIKNYRPNNLKIYTFNAGFKKKNRDLLIIVFENRVPVHCVYSNTSMPSAPIIWDKINNNGYCRVLIVNSGNANAHTGSLGIKNISKYVKIASSYFKCNKEEVLVSSTGIIGEHLDYNKIVKKIKVLNKINSESIKEAAEAIMTTDTFLKTSILNLKYNSKKYKIYGIAKGSGMIAPNMGTMLAYIFIEMPLNKQILKKILNQHIETTFNSITVDGDRSTSDTVMLFSTVKPSKNIKLSKALINKISIGVNTVMDDLSKQIVCDGEGISKLIEINIKDATTYSQAKKVAFSIAESLLVKTAFAGGDANWGRIISAIGKADRSINQNKIIIHYNKLLVAKNGSVYKKIDLNRISRYLKNKKIKINITLGNGRFSKTVWTTDLTNKYIKINADYRS